MKVKTKKRINNILVAGTVASAAAWMLANGHKWEKWAAPSEPYKFHTQLILQVPDATIIFKNGFEEGSTSAWQ